MSNSALNLVPRFRRPSQAVILTHAELAVIQALEAMAPLLAVGAATTPVAAATRIPTWVAPASIGAVSIAAAMHYLGGASWPLAAGIGVAFPLAALIALTIMLERSSLWVENNPPTGSGS